MDFVTREVSVETDRSQE